MSEYERSDVVSPAPKPWVRWLVLLGIAFVGGLLTMGWIVTRWDAAAPYLSWMRPQKLQPLSALNGKTPERPGTTEAVSEDDATTMPRRVRELEERIDAIAERASAASGNADRAEALLVAFAARRALDRGLQLGYMEGLLRDRFGRSQPQAVATIISASREPVTIEELRADLDAIAPSLKGAGPDANWYDGLRRELANMVIVRRADMPSGTPEARLIRASLSLEAGHVDRALAEVARLPSRDRAEGWIKRARRYLAAHHALDLIETTALLSPDHRTKGGRGPDTPDVP